MAQKDGILKAVRACRIANTSLKMQNHAISGGKPVMMEGLKRDIDFLNNGEYQELIATKGTIFHGQL